MTRGVIERMKSVMGSVKMALTIIVVGLCLHLLYGCSDRAHEESIKSTPEDIIAKIDGADSLTMNRPKEAIAILRSIDRSAIVDEQSQAYYNMVYSEASYFSDIVSDNDSLTYVAKEYYHTSNDHGRRARAYFQHGLVEHAASHHPEAMLAYMEAEASLAIEPNPMLEGLVHQAKGDIYSIGCLFQNAYDSFEISMRCFERAKRDDFVAYAHFNLGCLALAKRDLDTADYWLTQARDYAIMSDDKAFLSVVLHPLSELYLQQGDIESCKETLNAYATYDCPIIDESHNMTIRAMVAAEMGDTTSAYSLLESAEQHEQPNEPLIDYAKYYINRLEGNDKEALRWLEHSNERQDSTILTVLNNPVLNYQIGKLQSHLEAERTEHELLNRNREQEIRHAEEVRKHQRAITISIATIVVIILVGAVIYVKHRWNKMSRDMESYMATINELRLTNNRESKPLTEAVDRLYNDRLEVLNHLCETYYEHSDSSRQATKVFERVRETIEAIKSDEQRLAELESLVDSCRNNLMSKLREQCPKLNKRELRVALYSYAGFSSRAICIFMESNPVALSKIKYRIKSKIKECDAPDSEILISGIIDK